MPDKPSIKVHKRLPAFPSLMPISEICAKWLGRAPLPTDTRRQAILYIKGSIKNTKVPACRIHIFAQGAPVKRPMIRKGLNKLLRFPLRRSGKRWQSIKTVFSQSFIPSRILAVAPLKAHSPVRNGEGLASVPDASCRPAERVFRGCHQRGKGQGIVQSLSVPVTLKGMTVSVNIMSRSSL